MEVAPRETGEFGVDLAWFATSPQPSSVELDGRPKSETATW